jgi:hypothetical protein
MGQLYQEAISAITPINKKLEDVYNKIDAEARAWKWSAEATDKMKEIARDRIIGESPANEDKPITIAQNKALEKGTLDYYEAQKRGDNQVLKENQKQTKLLTNIANNTKSQPTTTETVQFTVIS